MLTKILRKKSKPFISLTAVTAMLVSNLATVPVLATTTINTDNTAIKTSEASTQKYRNVMYYGDWSIWGGQGNFYPKDIPADQLTHLNFAFVDFDAQGTLNFTDKDAATGHPLGNAGITYGDINGGILNAFQVLKLENPNLKIGVSLGGWSKSGDFSTIAANASIRAKFVENVMSFIKYTNMDFVDIDWEYPASLRDPDKVDNTNDEGTTKATPADKDNYILLLKDLKAALTKQGNELGKTYELSVALPAGKAKIDEGIDVSNLFNVVDFANIMTYDMAGAWDKVSGHQAALYTNPNSPFKGSTLSVDESVKYYLSKGAKPEKVVIGAAYYTRGWQKVSNNGPDTNNPGLFGTAAVVNKDADLSPTPGALNEAPIKSGEGGRAGGVWSYNALDKLKVAYPGLKEYWDDSAKAPYLYNESTGAFFSYDNARSIKEKAQYVKDNNLGGMIAWMASQDAKTTSTKHDELTKATKEALFGTTDLKDYEVKLTPSNVTAKLSSSKPAWGSGSVINLSFTNNEKLSATGEVLKSVEEAYKTLKNVKVYIKTNGITITSGQYPAPSVKFENGYYVLDFSSSYDGKLIKPGQTISLDLNTSEVIDNLSGVVSIEISQKMYQSAPEMQRQFIYSGQTSPETNTAPVISGVSNKEIKVGDVFNPLAGVTASDKEDGDLTSKITITGSVDTSKVGAYNLTYSVADSNGLTSTAKSTITVVSNTTPEIQTYSPTKAYVTGDIVMYNGVKYKAKWWTQGETPGVSQWGAWEKIS